MSTTTMTRTLADVYRERLEAADPSDKLYSAIADAIATMAPYGSETGDLRPSEIAWLDQRATEAVDAAKAAVIEAVAAVYQRELPRLLPHVEDPTVPVHLWEQGGDAITSDADLAHDAAHDAEGQS